MKRVFREGMKMLLQQSVFPLIYNINKRKQIRKGLVVFADAHHAELPEQMRLLYEELKKRGMHVVKYCFDLSKLSKSEGLRRMTAFMKLYAVSEYVVLCNNFIPVASCKKRPETKVIQLWHACGALKKFGYDAADDVPGWYKGNVYRNYDLVTVSGPEAVEPFKSAMKISDDEVVKPVGVSESDRLFDTAGISAIKNKFKSLYPEAEGRKVILWAPTFRGAAGDALVQSSESIGEKQVDKLGDNEDYFVIKSLHPHQTGAVSEMSTEELMMCSDAFITDYSSLCFKAVLYRVPIVYFAPDFDDYKKERGCYCDYESLPGVHPGENDTLENAVKRALREGSQMYENDETVHFLEQYMSGCDGKATVRIADYITKEV